MVVLCVLYLKTFRTARTPGSHLLLSWIERNKLFTGGTTRIAKSLYLSGSIHACFQIDSRLANQKSMHEQQIDPQLERSCCK